MARRRSLPPRRQERRRRWRRRKRRWEEEELLKMALMEGSGGVCQAGAVVFRGPLHQRVLLTMVT